MMAHKILLVCGLVFCLVLTCVSAQGSTYFYAGAKSLAVKNLDNDITYLFQDRLGSDINTKSLPFGQVLELGDRFGFTGKEQDASGLHYFAARYYDSSIGRFTSVDSVPSEPSYQYVGNNPLYYIDPDGRERVAVVYYSTEKWAGSFVRRLASQLTGIGRFDRIIDIQTDEPFSFEELEKRGITDIDFLAVYQNPTFDPSSESLFFGLPSEDLFKPTGVGMFMMPSEERSMLGGYAVTPDYRRKTDSIQASFAGVLENPVLVGGTYVALSYNKILDRLTYIQSTEEHMPVLKRRPQTLAELDSALSNRYLSFLKVEYDDYGSYALYNHKKKHLHFFRKGSSFSEPTIKYDRHSKDIDELIAQVKNYARQQPERSEYTLNLPPASSVYGVH